MFLTPLCPDSEFLAAENAVNTDKHYLPPVAIIQLDGHSDEQHDEPALPASEHVHASSLHPDVQHFSVNDFLCLTRSATQETEETRRRQREKDREKDM